MRILEPFETADYLTASRSHGTFFTTGIPHEQNHGKEWLDRLRASTKSKAGNATDPGSGQGPTVLPTVGWQELPVPDIVSVFLSETKVSKSAKIPGLNPRPPGS